MLGKILKFKIIILISIIVTLTSAINLSFLYLFLNGPLEENKVVIIPQNTSVIEIVDILDTNNIIKYKKIFTIIAKFYSHKRSLKSGEYIFTSGISPLQVFKILNNGKSIICRLLIQEGLTVNEILRQVNSEPRLIGSIIQNVPEGYLMPSTYYYSYGDRKEDLIERMRKLMSDTITQAMRNLDSNSQLKSRLDVLILASIIEKEALLQSEKPLIASVFLNRLKKEMKLQSCPTVIYALTLGKEKFNRKLTIQDLKINSPYNTYKYYGLPPTPISCPSAKSIQAVVNPANTKFLFFAANGFGGHNFSETFVEHSKYVKSYRNLTKKK